MKIIQPAEISGKIMTLVDLTEKHLILISPYNGIANWPKLNLRLQKALQRRISIKWFVRENEGNKHQIESLGIPVVEIPRLHCKIYLNERTAIVTSMNLNVASDTGSLDIGFETENQKEYQDVVNFVESFIAPWEKKSFNLTSLDGETFEELLSSYLRLRQFIEPTDNSTRFTFKNDFEIDIETKYPRLVLYIKGDYKFRNHKYLQLQVHKPNIEKAIGFKIDYGSQMKRLKFSLYEIDSNRKMIQDKLKAIEKIDKIINSLEEINFS